jgi:glucokinase
VTPSALALVADVGGTWVRFALARPTASGGPALLDIRQLAVAEHGSLIDAAQHYLQDRDAPAPRPARGVFGVAGRVEGERAAMTNHPWRIVASECAEALDLERVQLVNDFTTQALAVPHLGEHDRVLVGGQTASQALQGDVTYAVLGPGTGLGVSALLRRAGHEFALSSEGGHASFAPKTSRQREVLEHLSARFSRVSYERLVSGSGLSHLHWAMARRAGEAAPQDIAPEEVTRRAGIGDALARETLDVFCEVFGALAGDLVLTLGAWDGVFLSGGLVPLLLDELRCGPFRQAFERKGRFSEAMSQVPVYAVVHPQAGLLGAAAEALRSPAP